MPTHTRTTDFSQRCKGNLVEKNSLFFLLCFFIKVTLVYNIIYISSEVFSMNGAGTTGYLYERQTKESFESYTTSYTNINSK